MRVLAGVLLGGFGGFGVFVMGITSIAMSTDGSRNETAKLLRLTPAQLDIALPICATGAIAVGAIVCGTATARSKTGRIFFGARFQRIIRAVLFGATGTVATCYIVALIRGDTPQFRLWIIGTEWALRTTPIAVLVGAIVGNLVYQIASRRSQ